MNHAKDASILFEPEPSQWGLRGDPYLWREMRVRLFGTPMPENTLHLDQLIATIYEELTGFPFSEPKHFFVPRFSHGGMSSGMIAPEFWKTRALPLLRERLAHSST